jgi:hypothetical protein
VWEGVKRKNLRNSSSIERKNRIRRKEKMKPLFSIALRKVKRQDIE